MPFQSKPEFIDITNRLAFRLQNTAADFIGEVGFIFDAEALAQMSVSIESVTKEILMFGGDIWPDSISGDLERISERAN